jgi:hypothetical protein
MVKWYYVQGSERVGPVSEKTLEDLFRQEVLNMESYIWRKGFANWERLKDVSELNFKKAPPVVPVKPEKKDKAQNKVLEPAPKEAVKKSSPEIVFNFNWNSIGDQEELFFIKIGHDRKQVLESDLYGPYSLKELREAIGEKHINNRTLIFAPGMPGWIEVGQTPLDPKNFNINTTNVLAESPLLMVVNNDSRP